MSRGYMIIAQQLTGIAGRICDAYQLDAYLAFVAVAQRLHQPDQTRVERHPAVMLLPSRLPRHPATLHYHPVDQTTPFDAGTDSSCPNGPLPGFSYGDYGDCSVGFPGSGAVQFRCLES